MYVSASLSFSGMICNKNGLIFHALTPAIVMSEHWLQIWLGNLRQPFVATSV